jgi:hypothetical protein
MGHGIVPPRKRRQTRVSVRLEVLEERLCLSAAHHKTALHHVAIAYARPHHTVHIAPAAPHHITAHQTAVKHPNHKPVVQVHGAVWPMNPFPTAHLSLLHENDGGSSAPHVPTTVVSNYPGISSTGWIPADDNLAVSTTEVVEAANELLGFWTKSGTPVNYNGSNTISLATLFPGSAGGVYDPRIVFDPANGGHFILVGLEQTTSPQVSALDIAVSNDSSPTPNPSTWHLYRVNGTTNVGGTNCWLDFPGLGFDGQAIYVTANLFDFATSSFYGAKVMTFDKNALETSTVSGGSPAALISTVSGGSPAALIPANSEIIADGGSIQPAVEIGPAPAEYMIETWGTTTVRLHAITNPLNSSYARTTTFVTVPAYAMNVPDAPQLGSSTLIAANDTRIINAVWENGSLYAAHTFENTINGQDKATARWYQISTGNWPSGTPSLTHWGNIDPGIGIATDYPSIAVDANGTIAIGYAESSASMYASAYYTTITTSGVVTTGLVHAGQSAYTQGRWGDYSGTVADPTTPGVFWSVGMSTTTTGAWGTWWTSTAQPSDTIAVSAPTSATTGQPFTFTVSVDLPGGGLDTAYTGTVHFTSSDPQASLPADYTFTSADAGTHTFTATWNTAGTQSLTATDTANAGITGSQGGITVSAPAAPLPSALVVTCFPTSDTAGTAQTVTVRAIYSNGTTDTAYTGTVHFTSSDAQASLPADYTFTAADAGVHTFTLALKTAGAQSITATDTATASLAGAESGISVSPGAAAVVVLSGYPSPTVAGAWHGFTVKVKDAYGNTATGYTGTVHFTSSDAYAGLPSNYTFTGSDAGSHTFSAAFNTLGYQSIRVTDTWSSGLTATVSNIYVKKKH